MSQTAEWFEPEIAYSGEARVTADHWPGTGLGSGRAYLDRTGKWRVEVNLETIEDAGERRPITPEMLWRGGDLKAIRLLSGAGEFVASDGIRYNLQVLGEHGAEAELQPLFSEFILLQSDAPAYLVIPLFNFVSDSWQEREGAANHPLALSKSGRFRAIRFGPTAAEHSLELMPDYDVLVQRLQSHELESAITAVLVFSLDAAPEALRRLATNDLLAIVRFVSLCSASVAGASWFEYRDRDGGLVRRVHGDWERRPFLKTTPIYRSHPFGLGPLLQAWFSSSLFGDRSIRVLFRHAMMSTADRQTIEDDLSFLFHGFELIANYLGVAGQDLLRELDVETTDKVKSILRKAAGEVRLLDTGATGGSTGVVDEIARRVETTPLGRTNSFGLTVCKICEKIGLPDEGVVNKMFATGEEIGGYRSWSQWLSHVRGDLVHRGFLDHGGRHDIGRTVMLRDHLGDLLLRILLRLIGYEGTYSCKLSGAHPSVGWLRPEMEPRVLGYRRDLLTK